MTQHRTRLFLSYSRIDAEYRQELLVHLSPLKTSLDIWHDQHLQAGADWKRAIDDSLMAADIVLLLLSPDFLASEYCIEVELRSAFERWHAKSTCIVPIVVRECFWNVTPIAQLHVLCAAQPIGSLLSRAQRDAEWKKVVLHIHELAAARMQSSVSAHDLTGQLGASASGPDVRPAASFSFFAALQSPRFSFAHLLALVAVLIALLAVGRLYLWVPPPSPQDLSAPSASASGVTDTNAHQTATVQSSDADAATPIQEPTSLPTQTTASTSDPAVPSTSPHDFDPTTESAPLQASTHSLPPPPTTTLARTKAAVRPSTSTQPPTRFKVPRRCLSKFLIGPGCDPYDESSVTALPASPSSTAKTP